MKKLSKRLPGAGTNGVMAFTPFTGRGDSVLTNAPARGSTRRVDVQTGAANPPRRASSRNSSRLSLSMSPMMMPIMENEAADWNEPEPGSLVTMTIRNKKSHLYGKTILLRRLKNGLYKIINEDGDTQKDGPKEIVVDLDKALFENFAEDEIKKARSKSSMETHSASLNQSIKTGRSFKSRNTKKSQKKEYIDKLIDLQKNSELLNDYAGNSLSAMSKGKSSSKNKAPKAPEAPDEAVETKAVETPKAVSIPVSSASDLQDDPEQKASARGYGNAAYDRAIRSPNIKQNNSSNIVADIAPYVAPAAIRAAGAAGAWLLRNGAAAETSALLGPVVFDLADRGMEHKVYGDEIHGTIGLPNIVDKLTGMAQDAWNGNDVQAQDRERRSKLNADRGKLDGTPWLPLDQRPDYDRKKDVGYAITDYLGITKDPKKTAKSLAIASLRGTDVKKLKKASVLRGPIPGQGSDAEGYTPQTLNPRTLITPDIGHSIRYHAGDGVMRTEPVSDILERFKSRSKDGKLFASQLDAAPPPTIGIDSDSLNQSPTLQYKGRKRQGDGIRFGSPSKSKVDIAPETKSSDKGAGSMSIKNLARRLLHLDSSALEDASIDPSANDTEGISARDKAVDKLREELHSQFPPEVKEAPVTEAAENPKKQEEAEPVIDDFDF